MILSGCDEGDPDKTKCLVVQGDDAVAVNFIGGYLNWLG
jgi:hypothetical protein